MNDSEKLDLILAKLDALGAGTPEMHAVSAYQPSPADVSGVVTGLRQLGYDTNHLAEQNVWIMLTLTNGDVAQSIANFADSVQKHGRSHAIAELAAQGIDNPTEAQIADRASYKVWSQMKDQGNTAVAILQGNADGLEGL